MSRFHDAWLAYQQKRFMRPDAGRYVRTDAFRWLPADRVGRRSVERKFDPDQPRVPAGSPEGGQWTADGASSEGGVADEVLSAVGDLASAEIAQLFEQLFDLRAQSVFSSGSLSDDAEVLLVGGKGHHFVPFGVLDKDKYSFSPEALKEFKGAVTGPLKDPTSNRYDRMHREYNDAVEEAMDRFLSRNNIRSDQMTGDHARKFVDEVKRSSDPRIFNFNMRLYMREIIYWMRRIGRGTDA
jgi:hypothetical protein